MSSAIVVASDTDTKSTTCSPTLSVTVSASNTEAFVPTCSVMASATETESLTDTWSPPPAPMITRDTSSVTVTSISEALDPIQ